MSLLDFVFGQKIDFVNESQFDTVFKVLLFNWAGIILFKTGVKIVVLNTIVSNHQYAFVWRPTQLTLFTTDLGEIATEQSQLISDFIRKS